MDERIKSRLFRVTVTQGDRWRAHLENGGEVAAADSLYELRRRVASTAASLLGPQPEERIIVEWTYPGEDGEPHIETQEVDRVSAAPRETSARVGWHQRRVDEYLRDLRRRRSRDG